MPALPPSPMLRSLVAFPRSRASLLLCGALLSGCGGAASSADYAREAGPSGGSGGHASAIGSASPTVIATAAPVDPPSFMRVGDIARETLTTPVAAASAAPAAEPPKPIAGAKNLKGTTSTGPVRAATPPPPPTDGKPESDTGHKTPEDERGAVHAAVVDSASNLSEAEVRTTIVQKQASFRQCYDLGMSSSAAFAGTVSLRVSIGPTGTVASVEVLSSTTKIAAVDSCVTQAVRSMQFPAKGNGAVVAFPIEFGK